MNNSISFIVPVYNGESYVIACLDSIYALDLYGHEREVIVVDDGSTDGTPSLLKIFSATHDVRILSQHNKGLGAARNAGMVSATGDYIYFVDADDRLRHTDLRDVLTYMDRQTDIIGINITRISADGTLSPYRIYTPRYNHLFVRADNFIRGRNFMSSVSSYFFRREFLATEGLCFYEGIFHEDEEFTPRAFALANSFIAADVDLYEYYRREDSITTCPNVMMQRRRLRDMLKVIERLTDFSSTKKEYCDGIRCKLDYLAVDTLRQLLRQHHDPQFRKEIVDGLRIKNLFPLRWHWNFKYIAFYIFTRAFVYLNRW